MSESLTFIFSADEALIDIERRCDARCVDRGALICDLQQAARQSVGWMTPP
jgi:hypothetical protein